MWVDSDTLIESTKATANVNGSTRRQPVGERAKGGVSYPARTTEAPRTKGHGVIGRVIGQGGHFFRQLQGSIDREIENKGSKHKK